jgi:hypothetical protein
MMNEDSFKHGAFGWNELMTTDVEAAKRFYTSLFGWETEDMNNTGMKYTTVKVDGKEVAGMMALPEEVAAMPPAWGCYITVADVDDTAAKVESLGGKLLRPPEDIPNVGRFCVIQDPQGAVLCAMTYAQCDRCEGSSGK